MFANADRYAPDDAPLDPGGNMVRTQQGVMSVREEHPGPAAVGAYKSPVVALGALALFLFAWKRWGPR